jgi:hypothetical protein
MHPDLQSLLYKSQEHYLQSVEMKLIKHHVGALGSRLAIYKLLRDQELQVFQPVADQLQQLYPREEERVLEQCLLQWITVTRYAAMGMLMSNPEFLQHRLLEWLTDILQAQKTQDISNHIYELLQAQLRQMFSAEQLDMILPYLDQARASLVGVPSLPQIVVEVG